MKTALIILLVLHGIIHLLGFVKAFNVLPVKQFSEHISKFNGIMWLLAFLLFIASALFVLLKISGWQVVVITAVALSQILVFRFWKDAKFGTIANVIIVEILLMV